MFSSTNFADLDTIVHVIQVALTPIFLLNGVAALLGVFSTRLGRVADQVDRTALELETAGEGKAAILSLRLAYLRRRSHVLDVAVVLGACAGIGTACATLTLFINALRERSAAIVLFAFFAIGLICAVGALLAFLVEMLMASRGLRRKSEQEASLPRGVRS